MNVGFNPVLNFKSDTNLIAARVNQPKPDTVSIPADLLETPQFPPSFPPKQPDNDKFQKTLDDLNQALNDGKNIESVIKSEQWEKKYNPDGDYVHAKIPNSSDGLEYTIFSNGKVVSTNGWGRNQVENDENEKLADYVKQMKSEYEAALKPKAETTVEEKVVSDSDLEAKAANFKLALNDKHWKKEYLPESDIVYVKQKNIKDGLEYIIEKDGTVKETGLRIKPTVIMEANSQMAETFGKIKHKQAPETDKPHKSLWFKTKEGISKIWKFFTVTGTMTVAATKGLVQGAVVGAGVLASAILLKGGISLAKGSKTLGEIAKHPFATAGKAGKLLALAAGGAVLASHVVKGKLAANQKSAVIEHKMDVEHVNG